MSRTTKVAQMVKNAKNEDSDDYVSDDSNYDEDFTDGTLFNYNHRPIRTY